MFLRFCRKTIYPHLNSREACRGSNVVLGMAVVIGLIAVVAILISHLSGAL